MNTYRRALDGCTAVIRDVGPADLARPSPCAGWDLRALLAHMIAQNHGFAGAVEHAGSVDVDVAAFAPRAVDRDVETMWQASADRVAAAFDAAMPDAETLLPEVSTQHRIPVATVLAMHLLDTVVHTWDVAVCLEHGFRPDDELLAAVAEIAGMVPDGAARESPGAAFAPVVNTPPDADAWTATLARLGRRLPEHLPGPAA